MYTHTCTHTNTHTHSPEGHGSRCLAEAEEDSFEYLQRATGSIVARGFHCVLIFSTRNTASKTKKRGFTPSPSLALLLPIVLGSVVKIESRQATNSSRSKWYGAFPELNAAPVLYPREWCEQRWFWHPMNRGRRSKRRLTATCAAFWGLSVAFSPSEPMADNINVPERNTLPVLYNINVSTVILSPRQHYISIYISVTWSHTTSAKWKQAAPKNHLCNEPQIAGNEVCLEWVVIVWTMWFSIDYRLSFIINTDIEFAPHILGNY